LGIVVVFGGLIKSLQEARIALTERRMQARALRQQRREAP